MAQAKRAKGSAKARTATARPAAVDFDRLVIDAAMRLAAEQGWRNVTLASVAEAAGIKLIDLYARYPSRAAILAGFARRVDAEVLKGGAAGDGGDSPRDRLFDVMMRRYDAMKPYREAIAAIAADAPRDPLALLCLAGQARRSMTWMLEAAGIPSEGPLGVLKAKGLAAIHAGVMRVWLNDDSEDSAKTMAALDTSLKRVEPIARTLFARA